MYANIVAMCFLWTNIVFSVDKPCGNVFSVGKPCANVFFVFSLSCGKVLLAALKKRFAWFPSESLLSGKEAMQPHFLKPTGVCHMKGMCFLCFCKTGQQKTNMFL